MTPLLIVLAIAFMPFSWVLAVGAVVAVLADRDRPKRRAPHQLPRRHATTYLARMNALTQIAQQKQRKTR